MAKSKTPTTERFVALLRGINVGGKNMLPMKELVAMFEKAGATNVKNYIQSGNVVFSATPAIAKTLSEVIAKAIDCDFHIRVPVVLRAAEELRTVVSGNPFLKQGIDPNRLHVAFLADRPSAKQAQMLDPNRSPGDSFIVRGADIFLSIESAAKTKLTNAFFDSKLQTISTGRNWRTVLKLMEMLDA